MSGFVLYKEGGIQNKLYNCTNCTTFLEGFNYKTGDQ